MKWYFFLDDWYLMNHHFVSAKGNESVNRKEPKYIQVKNDLLNRFEDHRYQAGQRLPTEAELMDELSVSRTTVRQAIGELEESGIVRRRHGSGTYFQGFHTPEQVSQGGLIGLINFYFNDYIYPEIIRGIEETISEAGYALALANSRQNIEMEISSVERLIEQGVKGLILEPSRNLQIRNDHPMLSVLDRAQVPVVTTHWGISDTKISTVTIDDIQAGYEATRYLLDRGHREIAIIYKEDVQAGYDRFLGYSRAVREAGLSVETDRVLSYNDQDEMNDVMQGYLLTQRLLRDIRRRPTAVFYFNDNIAVQGYNAINEAGLSIPNDLSVIGFDNWRTADMLAPPLTTFEHPKYNLGKWAAKILLDEMDVGHPNLPMKLVFEPVLVERESVRTL